MEKSAKGVKTSTGKTTPIPEALPPNNIIILGMGSTRTECPFGESGVEIWGVNNGYRQSKDMGGKIHKLLIAHRGQEHDYMEDPIFDWEELNKLIDTGVEILTLFDLPELKSYKKIDYQAMASHFNTDYFSDSIAYMLAYAIFINTEKINDTGQLKLIQPLRIRMYGVDMLTKDEYATERGGIEYFVAVAKTVGIDFWNHPFSAVCRTDTGMPYGFFQLDKSLIDPHNIMERQKTAAGLKELLDEGAIDEEDYNEMIAGLLKLETGIELKDATMNDFELMMAWRSDPDIYQGFYQQNQPLTYEEHSQWLQSRRNWYQYIIWYKGRRIGVVSVGQLDHWNPEIGFYIGEKSLWDQGIGTNAVKAIMDQLKREGKEYCHTTVLKSNERSINLLKKLGFRRGSEARPSEVWMWKKLS